MPLVENRGLALREEHWRGRLEYGVRKQADEIIRGTKHG